MSTDSKEAKTSWSLYTIECEGHGGSLVNPVYYVGKTQKSIEARFNEHLERQDGAAWTGLHRPVRIVPNAGSALDPDDKFSEDTLVYRTMEIHGIENVRGGSYCQIKLSDKQIDEVSVKMNAASGRCFLCNQTGHVVKKCPQKAYTDGTNETKGEAPNTRGFLYHATNLLSSACGSARRVLNYAAKKVLMKENHKIPSYGKYRNANTRLRSRAPYAAVPLTTVPSLSSTRNKTNQCSRCGRLSHGESECLARKDIRGFHLPFRHTNHITPEQRKAIGEKRKAALALLARK
jgi:hypothetical protein